MGFSYYTKHPTHTTVYCHECLHEEKIVLKKALNIAAAKYAAKCGILECSEHVFDNIVKDIMEQARK